MGEQTLQLSAAASAAASLGPDSLLLQVFKAVKQLHTPHIAAWVMHIGGCHHRTVRLQTHCMIISSNGNDIPPL